MADNRLRCALVYRLDAGDETSVTMLAKYDHAAQYETSPGGSDLYGGRDKSYADAVGMVIGNDPPGATSEAGTIGGFKVCQSEVHQVVYGSDTDGLCKFLFLGFPFCLLYHVCMCSFCVDETIIEKVRMRRERKQMNVLRALFVPAYP